MGRIASFVVVIVAVEHDVDIVLSQQRIKNLHELCAEEYSQNKKAMNGISVEIPNCHTGTWEVHHIMGYGICASN